MLPPADLFDPRHYEAQRRDAAQAATLPAWCYTAPEFHRREIERVFLKGWLMLGRADEVPEPGDWMSAATPGGPLLLWRDATGELRCFANTCRHRGARLACGSGNAKRLACPYHAWTYRADGGLLGAPGMADTPGFEPAGHGLIPVRMEAWGGFLFATFDPDAPPLPDYLGDLPERLASHSCADMVCVRRTEHDVACNWKLLAENAMEAYHTGTVHSGSLGQQSAEPIATAGHWDAILVHQETSIAVLPGEAAPFDPIPTLAGDALRGTWFTLVHPNTQIACVQDCLWWLTFQPVAAERTRLEVGFCFPRATAGRPDFAEKAAAYFHRWDTGIAEDNEIGETQQAGLSSALARPGRFSARETAVHRLNGWLLDQVLDEDDAPRRI